MPYLLTFLLFLIEIFLFCCGGLIFAYSSDRKISESLSVGIFLTLILISLVFQVGFLLEFPTGSILLEIILSVLNIKYIILHRSILKQAIRSIVQFIIHHKIIAGIIISSWIYLFLLVAIIPPSNWDSMAYNLSRVYLFQQENSLFLENVTTIRQNMFVVGADILNHGFLRLNQDYGVGIFSWLAYISVGLGTYGLSRSFASSQVSLATTLIIISLPEFCFQATSTKNDIFTAASAFFCFIISNRILARPNAKNIGMLLLGLAYGFSAKTTFLAFLVPFILCFSAVLIFKVGIKKLYRIVIENWLYLLILIAPIIVISQSWLFWHNATIANDLTGGKTIKIVRDGSSLGLLANLVRYSFQSIHLFPLDYIAKGRLGIDLGEILSNIYEQIFHPIFNNVAMGYRISGPYSFKIKVLPHEDFSWYGFYALAVIVPAICWSLFKGNYWFKVQSLSLLGFITIFSHKLVWTPWNNRYVTLFFAASGACVAFFLQQIPRKIQSKILNGIKITTLIILISACVLNVSKPLGGLSITEFFKPNIWSKTSWGSDRLYYANKYHGDERIEEFRNLVPDGSKVALIAGRKSWIYHLYLVSPQVEIVPVSFAKFKSNPQVYDYLFLFDTETEYDLTHLETSKNITVWSSPSDSSRPSKLIRLR
ncbi:MAG: hypothetical protein QNJ60_08110 [Xenococcaceae cyanobacterium MO_188.B19]|nr:hypothetical protein [Xenococcaceae cyanobacterium MO_188.B19]